jgi:hypothetical protein
VPAAPLNVFPYLVLLYIVAAALYAVALGRRRPDALARAGAVLATGESETPGDAAAPDGRRLDLPAEEQV